MQTPQIPSRAIKSAIGRSIHQHLVNAIREIRVPTAAVGSTPLPPGIEVLRHADTVGTNIVIPSPNGPRYFEVLIKERF